MVLLVVVALSLQVLAVEDIGIETPSRLNALLTKISSSQGRRNLDFISESDAALAQAQEAITASLDQAVIDLDVTNEETADNSTLANGEGRRTLFSCNYADSASPLNKILKVKSVWIQAGDNGQYFCSKHRNAQFRTKETKLKVRLEIEDDDRSCPGCIEQVHVGLMDDLGNLQYTPDWSKVNHKCVQLGGGNFGRKTLDFEFSAQRYTTVSVFVTVGWQYECRGNQDIFDLWRYLPTHGQKHKVVRIELK